MSAASRSAADVRSRDSVKTFSVAQAAAHLEQRVKSAFDGKPVWVRGVLDETKKGRASSGHRYFALVEYHDGSQTKVSARLKAVIWRSKLSRVNGRLQDAGLAGAIRDGATVSMLGTFGYYPKGGTLSFHVNDIDVESLIAERLLARDHTVKTLRTEGVLGLNHSVTVTAMPLRVAIVTSIDSAAHHDVERVLSRSDFAIRTTVHGTSVQGEAALAGIVAALDEAAAACPDVILLCRGGGSDTDLRAFDDLDVARAVATCPMPVFAGIGHEIDTPAVDSVAHTAFSTPTAAAEGIMTILRGCEQHIHETGRHFEETLRRSAQRLRDLKRSTTDDMERELLRAHRQASEACTAQKTHLEQALTQRLGMARIDLRQSAELLEALDPRARLQQGWSLTRRADGTPVVSHHDVAGGDLLTTLVADGQITSRVEHSTPERQPPGEQR